MTVRKTSVAIDEDLLERAKEVLETDTIRDTIHAALIEATRAYARRAEARALLEMEGLELDDPKVMRGAWGD